MAKTLSPYEGMMTNLFFVLIALFVGLVIWEVVDQRRASRSSLDIAKLAAAAAKKQSAASAPSGNLAKLDTPPTTRPFAPPPPPPPSKAAPPPPPPPPSGQPAEAPAPAASPFGPPSTEQQPPAAAMGGMPAGGMLGAEPSVDSTVAFTPNDPGSSGGWADLLQRVRAGEPEAASFQESSPPPSTEDESFAMPSLESSSSLDPASSAGSSSEAWEALLKRTTGDAPEGAADPGSESGKIQLNSSFQMPGQSAPPPPPPPAPPAPSMDFSSPFDAPASNAFTQSLDMEPTTAPLNLGGGGEPAGNSPFSLPTGVDDGGATLAAPAPNFGFGAASGGGDAGASPFSLPDAGGLGGADAPPPTFKLPGAGAAASDNQTQSFQLPTGGGDAGGPNPFDFGGGSPPPPPPGPASQTTPLNDLFGGQGGAPAGGGAPSFQLPSGGADFMGGGAFDVDASNRTISLDFAKGGGQAPPPPFPKTEG